METKFTLEAEVLIIGGGVTGAGIMRDLSLRGINCILIDKKDLCAGASGGNHGLLHSGARYVSNDHHSAVECKNESAILKKIAPHCIEESGGLFAGVKGDDERFAEQFPHFCKQAGIDCEKITVAYAQQIEPCLSSDLQSAYLVPDATIDPFRLALENVAHAAMVSQSSYYPHSQVISFELKHEIIQSAVCQDNQTGQIFKIYAQQYVNAGGGWSMDIASLAGCTDVHLLWSKGTLLVSYNRISQRVINRLRPPSDGDILVPGGTVSILGTTSLRTTEIDDIHPTVDEVNTNVREGMAMIPSLENTRFIRAFSRVRPLVQGSKKTDARDLTRGYSLIEHENEDVENFCTITGGKLTTYRLMAEKASDLVAKRLGNIEPCSTHTISLPDSEGSKWTQPGAAQRYWYQANSAEDQILCECEMVPQSAIDQVLADAPGTETKMTLESIALRTRAGKGPCQGSFCGIRIASHLYEKGYYNDEQGLLHMKQFFSERFKGMRTVIWGQQMAQMELAEALHCGLLGLEKIDSEEDSHAP